MKGSQTKEVLNFISENPGCTNKQIDYCVEASNVRMILKRLRDRGDIVQDQGKYFRVSIPDEDVVESLMLKREENERRTYLKEFLDVVVESIRSCTDHNVKIQYIQEGRRLVKDLR